MLCVMVRQELCFPSLQGNAYAWWMKPKIFENCLKSFIAIHHCKQNFCTDDTRTYGVHSQYNTCNELEMDLDLIQAMKMFDKSELI